MKLTLRINAHHLNSRKNFDNIFLNLAAFRVKVNDLFTHEDQFTDTLSYSRLIHFFVQFFQEGNLVSKRNSKQVDSIRADEGCLNCLLFCQPHRESDPLRRDAGVVKGLVKQRTHITHIRRCREAPRSLVQRANTHTALT